MSLKLYMHPFASYCQKVLIALYENETPFEPEIVDLADEASRKTMFELWPIGKFPVLHDREKNRVVPESTIILEYLDRHYPGRTALVPRDIDLAIETRLQERFYDIYISEPMQKIVFDKLRTEGTKDPYGVERAKAQLETAYRLLENTMASRTWAAGDAFTMADCSAGPALFYAKLLVPFGDGRSNLTSYYERLVARPSFARVIEEAAPYFKFFPA